MSEEDEKTETTQPGFFRKHLYEIIAPPLFLGLILLIAQSNFFTQQENLTVNWRFKARADSDPPANKNIIVCGIDEPSLETFGSWPWPRTRHGDLLKLLSLRPPAVITFDLIFSEPSNQDIIKYLSKFPDAIDSVIAGIETPPITAADDETASAEAQLLLQQLKAYTDDVITQADADRYFAEAMFYHYYVITGAYSEGEDHEVNPPMDERGATLPLTHIEGDKSRIIGYDQSLYPIKPLREAGMFAFVDAPPSNIDGIRRTLPLVVRSGEHYYPSLALQSLISYFELTPDDITVKLGEHVEIPTADKTYRVPIDGRGRMTINYRHKDTFKAFPYSSLVKILQDINEGKREWTEELPEIQGSILLVGQVALGLSDLGPSPLESRSPLVLVHANAMNNILEGDYLKIMDSKPIIIGFLIIGWLSTFLLRNRAIWLTTGIPVLIVASWVVAAFYVFSKESLQLPLLWPILGFAGIHLGAIIISWLKESRSKSRIQGMFGTYLSPELVTQMVESGDEPQLGGIDANITAYFSDVQSFSTFSEQLTPKQLVDLMNEYLTAMTDILMENGCYVDKYIGDAIVGIFNAPVPLDKHALKACIASQLMQKRQAELREKWAREGDKWPAVVPNMQTRMGMNTGRATVGNMGSEKRFNYTMMGDTVNLAARCESGAKSYGVYTMITGECHDAAIADGDDVVFRYLDKIIVKGRSEPARMYESVCLKTDLNDETAECLGIYDDGIKAYLGQDFAKAIELFEKSAKLEPNRTEKNPNSPTTPSEVLLERCHHYKDEPPGDGWDGVFVMKTK